jgi:ribosome-associated toxin RatA of RatAB toxin-antitoxin module
VARSLANLAGGTAGTCGDDLTKGQDPMDIHFNDTQPAGAPAGTLFEVITDYASYPGFNPALVKVQVVNKDDTGAEFVADRKTKIGKQVRAYDRYERHDDFVIERTYEGMASARCTWTVHPVDASHCTLTIDASQRMRPVRGLVMRPFLRKLFYGINFKPFIEEAERRATTEKPIPNPPGAPAATLLSGPTGKATP